jgi:glutamate carboxypeptidase
LATLRALVELESPSGDQDSLARVADYVRGLLDDQELTTRDLPGGHLRADWSSSDHADRDHVLVVGHLDTVWPVGQLARMPFVTDETTAKGPGVFDMKGSLVALILALRIAQRAQRRPSRPVRILLVADEEVGSPDGRHAVAEDAARAHVVLGLESPLPGGDLKVGRHGSARIRLAVRGIEAHSGLDRHAGVSAIDELVGQLGAMRRFADDNDLAVNVGTIAGGTRANVIAGSAEAEIGLRYASVDEERRLFAYAEGIAPIHSAAIITMDVLSRRPAWEPAPRSPFVGHVLATADRLGAPISAGVARGAGDTNLTGSMGVPTIDGLGPRGSGAHAVSETVELSSIVERAQLLAELLTTEWPEVSGA